ncbi:hypothetical protein D3C86_1299850 [compost metagenome]
MFRDGRRSGEGIYFNGEALLTDFSNRIELAGNQGPGHVVEKITVGFEQPPLQLTNVWLCLDAFW